MAYPPSVPSGARINTTPQVNTHPADHVSIHAALTDIINELGSNPSGDSADLTAWLGILCPLGEIKIYAGATAPSGWGLCDGTAVSRATYADLFALIGTTYGVGDGSKTFNLPDLRSRFVAGKGTATWSDALNESGGSKDTTLVAHEHTQPTHAHTQQGTFASTDPGNHTHAHGDGYNAGSQSPLGAGQSWMFVGGGTVPNTGGAGAHTHNTTISGATTSNGGENTTGVTVATGSATNTNLPPYLTLNHIIRLT